MGGLSMFDLTGYVSVVTGGSRGIGAALALGLARAGSDVVVASRKLDNCAEVAEKITAETGRRALPVAFHAGRWAEADRLVETVYDAFGRCDVLVNNAGIALPYGDLLDVTEALWDKTHEVNARGPFRLATLMGERMHAAGGGSIINVSSVAARAPRHDNIVYGMSKAALDTLSLGLAARYGPVVRVNTLYPKMIATEMLGSWEDREAALAAEGAERVGVPEDLVGAAIYLAGAASRYTSGAVIPVA